jgi:hypothetical protein
MRGIGLAHPHAVQAHPVNCALLWNSSFLADVIAIVSHRPEPIASHWKFKLHHYPNTSSSFRMNRFCS